MDKIKIKGYKSINELEFTLKPINIFIGSNGSGKSNFLSFFDFLNEIYKQNLREYVALKGIESFLHKGSKVTENIYSRIYYNRNDYSFRITKGDSDFIFTKENLWYNGDPFNIASYNSESNLLDHNSFRATYIRDYLEQLSKFHFHDTGKNSPFNKGSNIDNDKFKLYKDGSNLAAFLYKIKNEYFNNYKLIIKTIQSIAPYFFDFFIEPNKNGFVKLRWRSKHSETIYGVNDLSDGTIRFIALATLFLQPNLPQTIIIDEPELGLHPSAIAKLAGLIKSAAAKECQIIIATQSTDLISHFEPENIVTVDLIDGESKFKRLSFDALKDWLADYTIDDLWKRNIINTGQPNF